MQIFNNYSRYIFATITTIGFGDVVAAAGYDHGDECEKDYVEYDFYHQENFFWVMIFLKRKIDL